MSSISPVVLLVDDHEDTLAMYQLALQAMGFQPLPVATAEEAFACACDGRPDIVVADIVLPGLSGFELTRQLRNDARTAHLGVIMLSAHSGASVQQEAAEAGCDRFLLKPCRPDQVAREIREVLGTRSAAPAEAGGQ